MNYEQQPMNRSLVLSGMVLGLAIGAGAVYVSTHGFSNPFRRELSPMEKAGRWTRARGRSLAEASAPVRSGAGRAGRQVRQVGKRLSDRISG